MVERRYGKFWIDTEVIEENADVVKVIMGNVIVLRAEHDYTMKRINYVAQCDAFEELDAGAEPPDYDVGFDPDTSEVTWSKAA